jgi:mannose-1-phosphate guanylyltransferase
LKALLIAGGLGTRLRPLTFTRPKHLLPIANRPHIEHVLDLLVEHSIHEVVLLTSYLAEAFSTVIERAQARGVTIEVAHETEPLGTAGAIKNAQDLIGDDSAFVFNGDVLSSVDLSSTLRFHQGHAGTATIVLTPVDDPSAYGVVETEPDGRVQRFIEKPAPGETTSNLINAGIYILDPPVLDLIPAGDVVSIEREVFPRLAEAGQLYALETAEYWMDIGTPEKYLQANLDALDGTFLTDAVADPRTGTAVIADTAKIADGAQVSSACIGQRCVIEEGAVVTESVLLDGVVVGQGATVTRSTLGQDAKVKPGSTVSGLATRDGESVG